MIQCISTEDKDAWNQILKLVPHTFFHGWEYNQSISQQYGRPVYLYHQTWQDRSLIHCFYERTLGNDVDICTPSGFGGLYFPFGSFDWETEGRKFFAQRGYVCGYFTGYPGLSQTVHSNNDCFVWDIRPNISFLRSKLVGKGKRSSVIPRPNREYSSDKESASTEVAELHAATEIRLKQKLALPARSIENLLASENTWVRAAFLDNKCLAISILGIGCGKAEYLCFLSDDEGRKESATLIWQQIPTLKKHSIISLNLGGGIHRNDSLAKFKKRFGATQVPFANYPLIFNSKRYFELEIPNQKYFPSYRSQNVS